MKNITISATLAAVLGLATMVQAEEYWLKENITSGNPFTTYSSWTNSLGEAASSFGASDILHIPSGFAISLSANSTVNATLHSGSAGGTSSADIQLKQRTLTLFDLRWHDAVFRVNRGSSVGVLAGSATLDNPSGTHTLGGIASSGGALILQSDLTCSDSSLAIKIDTHTNPNSYIVIAGDNSAYQGYFDQRTHTSPLIVAHANALGSPSVAQTDALSINVANAVFSVLNGVTPNAARGIDINKSGFHICATNYTMLSAASAYADCSEFELPMPITGSCGFTKTGPGTVTLSGAYTAGDIAVENGTLDIAATASFPAGQNISVAAGASLVVHQSLSGFNISGEGTWEQVLDPLVVEYDDSTHTATAIARGSSYEIPAGVKQPISLSEPVALPLHVAPAQQEVLTVAAGAADLSADDFVDATEKTYGLPKTSFTVEKDGAGVQHVYLTIRPVVVSLITFQHTVGINGNADTWSNASAAQPGFDYLITNAVNGIKNVAFAGDSLTIANADVYSRDHSTISTATIYPGNTLRQNDSSGGGRWTITGNICIAGEYGGSKYLTFQARYAGGYHRLLANLSGAGSLKLVGAGVDAGIVGGYPLGSPQLYGDNSAYHGKMYVTYSDNNRTEHNGTPFGFNSAAALGGALDTFQYDSLELDRYSMMRPATSIDFSTVNRGIYGSGPFGFDVTNGITFKVGVPVKMDDIMFKHGEGDLILGGAISYGASSTKTCYVREGGIGALNDAAVAGLDIVFSNGTKIVIAPEATLVNGFTGVSFEPADAATKVNVGFADDFATSSVGDYFRAVIATVPTSAGDLSSHFVLEKIRGLTGIVETESVTIGETPCTRYSAKYTLSATTIIMR